MGRSRAVASAGNAAGSSPLGPPPPDEPPGRHYRAGHAALWLKIAALTTGAVLLAVVAFGGFLAWKLQDNVTTSDLNAAVDAPNNAPEEATGSLQILILGTDTRAGANSEYGTAEDSSGPGRSDVMLLMNISADNSRVSITSFPRDLMVPIPSCKDAKTGKVDPGVPMGQLNTALDAGPGCTVAAINAMTGLTIDHFMLADFTAVKELSSALGGVEVCVDHAMYDYDGSHLRLPAGKSLVEGEQALAFLRTRHSFGNSSDLDRIKAQQYFLGSMVRKIKSDGTLNNLPRLYTLADVVTKNLTIDKGLANVPAMIGIATRLNKINIANVAFITAPTEPYVADPNRVQLKQPDAAQLFAALRQDADFTGNSSQPTAAPTATASGPASGSASSTPAPTPTPTAGYDKSVQPIGVLNASGVADRATDLVAALTGKGYSATVPDGDAATAQQTQVAYGANMADVAADVAALFKIPGSALVADPAVNGVQLRVGADWSSGTDYSKLVLPKDIVSSTANEKNECLTVNPLYYTDK